MSRNSEPIWHMTENNWDDMRADIRSGEAADKCYGSLHYGSVAADIVSCCGEVYIDLYVKGFAGYAEDSDGVPFSRAANCIVHDPFDYATFDTFKAAALLKVGRILRNGDLKMSDPVAEGFTADPKMLLDGANGTWA